MKKILLYSIGCFITVAAFGIASVAAYKSCPLCVDELKELGAAGDAIAGLSAIVLGALGVAATFAAFYIQYQANVSLHKDSLKEGFDRKFFELVQLFAQSVNTLQIKIEKEKNFKDKTGDPYELVQGKKVFRLFHSDFFSFFDALANLFKERDVWVSNSLMRIAFLIVYYGRDSRELTQAVQDFYKILTNHHYILKDDLKDVDDLRERVNWIAENYQLTLDGIFYNELLCHYFKQLYFIVKFVIESKEISAEELKDYFSMLCGQLSFNEQLMLFYSWISGIEEGLNESQLITAFKEYGLINDVLDNSATDGIDIRFILGVLDSRLCTETLHK